MQREPVTVAGGHEVLRVIADRVRRGSRPGKRQDGLRVALAIEGGGMRGTVSAGMALAQYETEVAHAFDAVYGASAGAITGAWLLSGTPERKRSPYRSRPSAVRRGARSPRPAPEWPPSPAQVATAGLPATRRGTPPVEDSWSSLSCYSELIKETVGPTSRA